MADAPIPPFPVLIPALKAAGFSYAGQAYLCNVGERTISNWAKGIGKPDWDQGNQLKALYEIYCVETCGGSQAKADANK
jgi:hypothetical protein